MYHDGSLEDSCNDSKAGLKKSNIERIENLIKLLPL